MDLLLPPVHEAVGLLEDQDEVGDLGQVGLLPGRPHEGQVGHPLLAHPLQVIRLLLGLHDPSDLFLRVLVRNLE